MRNLGCFLAIVLCAGPICLAAKKDSRASDRAPDRASSPSVPAADPLAAAVAGLEAEQAASEKDKKPNRNQVAVDPDSMLHEAITRLDLAGVQAALSKAPIQTDSSMAGLCWNLFS